MILFFVVCAYKDLVLELRVVCSRLIRDWVSAVRVGWGCGLGVELGCRRSAACVLSEVMLMLRRAWVARAGVGVRGDRRVNEKAASGLAGWCAATDADEGYVLIP